MLTLRPYQQEAVASVYEHLRTRDDNPCVVICRQSVLVRVRKFFVRFEIHAKKGENAACRKLLVRAQAKIAGFLKTCGVPGKIFSQNRQFNAEL